MSAAMSAAATTGDEIIVAPGTYNEAIDFAGKSVVLRSSDGAEATTLSGIGLSTSILRCVASAPDTMSCGIVGFTLTKGGVGTLHSSSVAAGGAIYASGGVELTVEACHFIHNTVSSPIIAPSFHGAGIFANNPKSLIVRGCTFEQNTIEAGGAGGAITVVETIPSSVMLSDCLFIANAAEWGGAVAIGSSVPGSTVCSVERCVFRSNVSTQSGGAIQLSCNAPLGRKLSVTQSTFESNVAAGRGGAVNSSYADLIVKMSEFVANASAGGGAINLEESSEGSTFEQCAFIDNKAASSFDGNGGALKLDHGIHTLANLVFRNNSATMSGGAVDSFRASLRCTNSVFVANHADSRGSGLNVRWFGMTEHPYVGSKIMNCVVLNNTCGSSGGAAVDAVNVGVVRITNCVLRGNTNLDGAANVVGFINPGWTLVSHSNVDGGVAGGCAVDSNFDLDPCFMDAEQGDYHLRAGSPCIDRGAPWDLLMSDVNADIDGNARMLDSDGDGLAWPDVGVDEVDGVEGKVSKVAPRLLAFWHFNETLPAPVGSDVGSAQIDTTGWPSPLSYFPANGAHYDLNRLWDIPPGSVLKLPQAAVGVHVDFRVSMEGRAGLVFSAQMSYTETTPPMQIAWEWSADGSAFAPVPPSNVPMSYGIALRVVDFRNIEPLNGASEVVLRARVVSVGQNTFGQVPALYFDNVRIDATPIEDLPSSDLNQDSRVDGSDLGILLSAWGACEGCAADLDGDGAVNGADLGWLLGQWSP